MSRYQISGHLPMPQQQPGLGGQVGNFLINRGIQAGLDAYAPGAGTIGGDLAREFLPGMVPRFNEGGKLGKWMGWGPTMDVYKDAAKYYGGRMAGALPSAPTREDLGLDPESLAAAARFWKAPLATTKSAMGYNMGGEIDPRMSPKARYHLMRKREWEAAQREGRAPDYSSIADYKNHGGDVHGGMHPQEKKYQMDHSKHLTGVTEYKQAGGKVGPLAKTVMKDMDGNSSERHYHDPMKAKATPTAK